MKVSWHEVDYWTQEVFLDGYKIGNVERNINAEWLMKPRFVYKTKYQGFMKSGYESAYQAGKALVELYKASRKSRNSGDTDEYNIESLFYFPDP